MGVCWCKRQSGRSRKDEKGPSFDHFVPRTLREVPQSASLVTQGVSVLSEPFTRQSVTNNRAHTQETYYCLPAGRFTSLGSKVIRLKEAPLHMNVPRVGESATRCLPNPDPVKHSASSIILSITSRPLFCLARLTMSRSNCARPVKDLTLEVITLCLSLAESQYVHTHELPLLHKVPCFLGTPNFRIVRGTPQRSLKVRVQYFSPANGRLSTGNTRQRHFEMSIFRLQSCGIGIMLV